VALFGGTTSCATRPVGPAEARRPAGAQAKPDAAQNPVIVRLVGRHYEITCSSSPTGPVYTAATRDGEVIVANATLVELRDRHPEIYEHVIPTIAEHGNERSARGSKPLESDASVLPVPISIMADR
jgi:hypothetical protein